MRSRAIGWVIVLVAAACSGETGATTTVATVTAPAAATPATTTPATVVTTSTLPARSAVVPATHRPPSRVELDSECMAKAVFGDPDESLYVLPYPVGEAYRVNQSYCFAQGGHWNQIAYDFLLPIGAEVVAARSGTVVGYREDIPNGDLTSENFIHIRHEDGSMASYAHLDLDGVDVEEGQWVEAGERIGISGMSGLSNTPHLHFSVVDAAHREVGVNFRNADGPLDLFGGLLRDAVYEAVPDGQLPDRPMLTGPGSYAGEDLAGSQLAGAMLWGFDFGGADLSGSDLSGANLDWARLGGASLVGTDLSFATLDSADLREADLRDALLVGAYLSQSDLRDADLRGADLTGAYLAAAELRGADLSGCVLTDARLIGVTYDDTTIWPEGVTPPPRP